MSPEPHPSPPPEPAAEPRRPFAKARARILSGLFLALPFVITFWIVYWLYNMFQVFVLDPIAHGVDYLRGRDPALAALPDWWDYYAAPILAIALVLGFLYLLGLVVRSRIHRLLDWFLLRVPLVTTIYQAVRSLFDALESQRSAAQFKRVVLVEFPQPGMRSLGMVTNTLHDTHTGRKILCVCVLTGVMPPTGFTLFVPEESVTDLPWTLNQAIQVIVSGGITTPPSIRYFPATSPLRDDPTAPPRP